MYPREIKEELDKLSKEVFGSSSKWKKMVEDGVIEPVLEDTKRLIPDPETDGDYKTETIKTQVSHFGANGGELSKFEVKRYTVDSIKAHMLDIKARFEAFRENVKKLQEEQKAKEEADKAAKEQLGANSGSAV
jgi:hypothetical protein